MICLFWRHIIDHESFNTVLITVNNFIVVTVAGYTKYRVCVCARLNVYLQLNELSANMQRIYSTATVCDRPGDTSGACYPLDPGETFSWRCLPHWLVFTFSFFSLESSFLLQLRALVSWLLIQYNFFFSPDLSYILSTSTDWDELVWAWQGWRDASGKQMPDMYSEFVGLLNEAARLNGDYSISECRLMEIIDAAETENLHQSDICVNR